MNLHDGDGVSELTQHRSRDTRGHSIIYAWWRGLTERPYPQKSYLVFCVNSTAVNKLSIART